jgi:hypothetical protein
VGLSNDLKRRALEVSQKAMEKLMADEKRAMQFANAVGRIQKGKQALERGQDQLLRTLNLAAKGDMKALGKRFSALKRRLRELEEKLDAMPRK